MLRWVPPRFCSASRYEGSFVFSLPFTFQNCSRAFCLINLFGVILLRQTATWLFPNYVDIKKNRCYETEQPKVKKSEIIYDYISAFIFCQTFRISYTIKNINWFYQFFRFLFFRGFGRYFFFSFSPNFLYFSHNQHFESLIIFSPLKKFFRLFLYQNYKNFYIIP